MKCIFYHEAFGRCYATKNGDLCSCNGYRELCTKRKDGAPLENEIKFEIKSTSPDADYSAQKHFYQLLIGTDDIENPVSKIVEQITSSIVEDQEKVIMERLCEIGGTTYRDITIDKNKVLDMFKRNTATKVLRTDAYPHRLYCPNCYHTLLHNEDNMSFYHEKISNNCPACGQKLDWSDYILKGENK